jgi:hypothetical protein
MTFKEQLHAHVGGLVCLKSQLYWYDSDIWDGINERVCLLLDLSATLLEADGRDNPADAFAAIPVGAANRTRTCALLLIDGSPKWIWISEKTTELIR